VAISLAGAESSGFTLHLHANDDEIPLLSPSTCLCTAASTAMALSIICHFVMVRTCVCHVPCVVVCSQLKTPHVSPHGLLIETSSLTPHLHQSFAGSISTQVSLIPALQLTMAMACSSDPPILSWPSESSSQVNRESMSGNPRVHPRTHSWIH